MQSDYMSGFGCIDKDEVNYTCRGVANSKHFDLSQIYLYLVL